MYTAKESKDSVWTAFGTQTFSDAPYDIIIDTIAGIMYTSNWDAGVWAYKMPTSSTVGGTGSVNTIAQRAGSTAHMQILSSAGLRNNLGIQQIYDIRGKAMRSAPLGRQAVIVKSAERN